MPGIINHAMARVRRLLLGRATSHGIDLSQLARVPDSLTWPLRRDGVDPVARLGEVRAQEPVTLLTSFLGLNIWLATGEAESKAVLAGLSGYSNDIRPFVGARGSAINGDIGGLGFTDPPDHTRLRKLLAPGSPRSSSNSSTSSRQPGRWWTSFARSPSPGSPART